MFIICLADWGGRASLCLVGRYLGEISSIETKQTKADTIEMQKSTSLSVLDP